MLAWELVGAVVGAGLASGREIASFFAKYGEWSWLGILLAAAMLIWLADDSVLNRWANRPVGIIWNVLLKLLLIVTGGAMMSGAGEVTALMLPLPGAYAIGMVGTFLLAWFLASKTVVGLAWVSRVMLCVLAVLIGMGFLLPPMRASAIQNENVTQGLLRSLAYGGFNTSLMLPILALKENVAPEKRRSVWKAAVIIGSLLAVGNAVLLRHPALLGEPMPFLRMMGRYGKLGYGIGSLSLYLAILSTLTACIRGLDGRLTSILAIAIVSVLGFYGVVERCYPILGWTCFAMLCAAKFLNYFSKAFHSRKDML